jgi:hypothetical protein
MPQWLLLTVEIVGLCLFVAGCALIYVPAAFLVAGLAVVVSCERWAMAEAASRR